MTQPDDPALVAALQLLFDGKSIKEMAAAIVAATGDNTTSVWWCINDLIPVAIMYAVDEESFLNWVEYADYKWDGSDTDLKVLLRDLNLSGMSDYAYDVCGQSCRDMALDLAKERGLLVDIQHEDKTKVT